MQSIAACGQRQAASRTRRGRPKMASFSRHEAAAIELWAVLIAQITTRGGEEARAHSTAGGHRSSGVRQLRLGLWGDRGGYSLCSRAGTGSAGRHRHDTGADLSGRGDGVVAPRGSNVAHVRCTDVPNRCTSESQYLCKTWSASSASARKRLGRISARRWEHAAAQPETAGDATRGVSQRSSTTPRCAEGTASDPS